MLPLDPELYWTHCSEEFWFGMYVLVVFGLLDLEAKHFKRPYLFWVHICFWSGKNYMPIPIVVQQSSNSHLPIVQNSLKIIQQLYSLAVID